MFINHYYFSNVYLKYSHISTIPYKLTHGILKGKILIKLRNTYKLIAKTFNVLSRKKKSRFYRNTKQPKIALKNEKIKYQMNPSHSEVLSESSKR